MDPQKLMNVNVRWMFLMPRKLQVPEEHEMMEMIATSSSC
jgi:hypothetical protein